MPEVAPPLMCGGGPAASHNARSGHSKDAVLIPTCITGDVTHALKADGFDGSEDGTGRGQPMVACFGGNNTAGPIDVATARNASGTASGRMDFESETFAVVGPLCANGKAAGSATQQDAEQGMLAVAFQSVDFGADATEELSPTLRRHDPMAVALRGREGGATAELGDDCGHALRASGGGDKPHVLSAMQVRRLTPRECERLQGFPDDYTLIPWKNKPAEVCPDGPRYKALGNSMAVPCMRWIGRRIELYGKS